MASKILSKIFSKIFGASFFGFIGYEFGTNSKEMVVVNKSEKPIENEKPADIISLVTMIFIIICITIAFVLLKEVYQCIVASKAKPQGQQNNNRTV